MRDGVGDRGWLRGDWACDDVVEGDDIVAEVFGELEGALELGGGRAWRPGDVEVVEHGGGVLSGMIEEGGSKAVSGLMAGVAFVSGSQRQLGTQQSVDIRRKLSGIVVKQFLVLGLAAFTLRSR